MVKVYRYKVLFTSVLFFIKVALVFEAVFGFFPVTRVCLNYLNLNTLAWRKYLANFNQLKIFILKVE
jgi:hypothetical protein